MSLRRVVLRDFVIVRALELDFSGGFTVLTGETGAGKSILVDALLLRRTIDSQGKSRAWINGSPATAGQLREAGDRLVDIHGQHAWQSLTRPEAVRGLLDGYAGIDTQPLSQAWHGWRAAQKALAEARDAQDSLQRDRERLSWQIAEVDKLAPGADEWDELNTSHTRLANAQSLIDAARQALDSLEGEEGGATGLLARAQSALEAEQQLEPEFRAVAEVVASSLAQAEDAAHSLHAWLRRTELDPQRLAELDERMSLWLSLARRFRRTPAELPEVLAGWKDELARLDAAADLAALEAAEHAAHQAYLAQARLVSKARAKAAPRLAQAITQAMQGMGMQGGRFEVALDPAPQPTQSGLEDVGFLVAGHAGSTPRPVGKVASGGELSRIALAIAVTTSQLGSAQTLIFDEVDAGVGGAVAETVGRLMKQLGRDRQVLAVTHLPQVAACADHHLVVAKKADAQGTASSVTAVSNEQRVAEVARMLAGERLSGTTLAHAKEMLGEAARSAP